MQARSLGEPNEISDVYCDYDAILVDCTTPEHVIRRAAKTAIPGVVHIYA